MYNKYCKSLKVGSVDYIDQVDLIQEFVVTPAKATDGVDAWRPRVDPSIAGLFKHL